MIRYTHNNNNNNNNHTHTHSWNPNDIHIGRSSLHFMGQNFQKGFIPVPGHICIISYYCIYIYMS